MCIGIPPEVIQLLLVRFELPSKASDQPLPRFLLRLPRSQPLDDVLATLPEEPEYRARTCFLNDWPLTSVERRDLEARVTLGLVLHPFSKLLQCLDEIVDLVLGELYRASVEINCFDHEHALIEPDCDVSARDRCMGSFFTHLFLPCREVAIPELIADRSSVCIVSMHVVTSSGWMINRIAVVVLVSTIQPESLFVCRWVLPLPRQAVRRI